jgi:hypothetical protein
MLKEHNMAQNMKDLERLLNDQDPHFALADEPYEELDRNGIEHHITSKVYRRDTGEEVGLFWYTRILNFKSTAWRPGPLPPPTYKEQWRLLRYDLPGSVKSPDPLFLKSAEKVANDPDWERWIVPGWNSIAGFRRSFKDYPLDPNYSV